MLKVTTKRTTVILLALVMSLGLFVAAYGGNQTINANISPTVNLDSVPSITTWNMTPDQTNTTPGGKATVEANGPYTLTVKSSTTGDGDQYMTGNQSSTDLQEPFKLQYNSSTSEVTSAGDTMTLESVTTSGGTAPNLFKELTAPDGGSDTVGVKFSQELVAGDPAYSGVTQINYSIILTWTASASV